MTDQHLAEEGVVAQAALGSSGSDAYITVAADGSGDYSSIQAAIDALPDQATGRDDGNGSLLPIRVKAGVYYEKLHMEKPGIHLIGEGLSRRSSPMMIMHSSDSRTARSIIRSIPIRRLLVLMILRQKGYPL